MNERISAFLDEQGIDTLRFVDISSLPEDMRQGYPSAVLMCIPLRKDFVMSMIGRSVPPETGDDFTEKEHLVENIADTLAEFIRQAGYDAYSQSVKNNSACGNYDRAAYKSRLPNKTVARIAGLGFIGKSNLMITKKYGSAFCMSTVLTDAPIVTHNDPIIKPRCGKCAICRQVCVNKAITGTEWTEDGGREAVVDVFKCRCPLQCMVNCPFTLGSELMRG